MQDLLHARQVDFRIFDKGMVSLHQQRARRQQQQPKIVRDLLLVRKNFHSPIARPPPSTGGATALASIPQPMMRLRGPPALRTVDRWAADNNLPGASNNKLQGTKEIPPCKA